jgi:SnoaL-like domain
VTEVQVLTRMLHAIDDADWDGVRRSFTDPVRTDYTSLWGGEPETLAIGDLVARWREFAAGFAATQHQTGPLVVSGDEVETHVIAYHWFADEDGGDTWTVHGHYRARIVEGRIAELVLHAFHASGHDGLPHIAGQRRGL